MPKLLLNKTLYEHSTEDISSFETLAFKTICFKKNADCKCIEIVQTPTGKTIQSSYYIGTDWLYKNEISIYIAPKLNSENQRIDYLKMLYSCLQHPDVAGETQHLYEVKTEEPFIEIQQNHDLLTPLLIIQFLQILKHLVKKGLKKSYYRVEKKLNAKVKGKVLISQTLKQGIYKKRPEITICGYEEFGINYQENKILKRTLIFVQKYLALFPEYSTYTSPILNYCLPYFQEVDENADIEAIKKGSPNLFHKEYQQILPVAQLILKRFGYNIHEVESLKNSIVKVPPFWIDMPKLFELYILGLLKDKYFSRVQFQIKGTYGRPDFILRCDPNKMIIDTKYKRKYQHEKYEAEDIRQMSGYSRDIEVLAQLGYTTADTQIRVVDCLIIYPDQAASATLSENLKETPIKGFTAFYKMAIQLPVINYPKPGIF